jgi:hypothetical protein
VPADKKGNVSLNKEHEGATKPALAGRKTFPGETKYRAEVGNQRCSQHQLVQVPLHNHVLDTLHRLVQKIGVGSVGEVHVGLLARVAHEVLEFAREEILSGVDVLVGSSVVGEVFPNGRLAAGDLFAEQIDLVEEEDEGGLFEVLAVGDTLEQHERFLHLVLGRVSSRVHRLVGKSLLRSTYAIAIFHKHVVVTADCNQEKDDLNVVEHVNPLLTLRPLSANVEHAVGQVASVEDRLADTSCS